MKKFPIATIALVLFCSCSTNTKIEVEEPQEIVEVSTPEEPQTDTPLYSTAGPVCVAIVDEYFNDRLDPESPSYWGYEYINGTNVFVMYKGERLLHINLFPFTNSEEYGGAVPRFAIDEYYAHYTHIPSDRVFITEDIQLYAYGCGEGEDSLSEDGEVAASNWIVYPDGNEDEIRVQMGGRDTFDWYVKKVWINGELAFQREFEDVIVESLSTPEEPFIFKQAYYNPKFYPWMKPVLTDKGEQMGLIAAGIGHIVVLVK